MISYLTYGDGQRERKEKKIICTMVYGGSLFDPLHHRWRNDIWIGIYGKEKQNPGRWHILASLPIGTHILTANELEMEAGIFKGCKMGDRVAVNDTRGHVITRCWQSQTWPPLPLRGSSLSSLPGLLSVLPLFFLPLLPLLLLILLIFHPRYQCHCSSSSSVFSFVCFLFFFFFFFLSP